MNTNSLPNYITRKTLNELQKRLEHLQTVELPAIAQEKSAAYQEGGIHENAGWEAAAHQESLLLAEINQIKSRILDPVVIDDLAIDAQRVGIGTAVEILDVDSGEVSRLVLVGFNEGGRIDEYSEYVSVVAPITQAMLGKKRGETIKLTLPNGSQIEYRILSIETYFRK